MKRFLSTLVLALVLAAGAGAQTPYGAKHTPNGVFICRDAIASTTSRSVMSRTTANRIAYKFCRELRDGKHGTEGQYFFRAIVLRGRR